MSMYVAIIMAVSSCTNIKGDLSESERLIEYDIRVERVETISNPFSGISGNNSTSRFLGGTQYNFELTLPGATESYYDSKKHIIVENLLESNSFLGLIVDKKYGVDICAHFRYHVDGDTLRLSMMDMDRHEIYTASANLYDGKFYFGQSKNLMNNTDNADLNLCNLIIYSSGTLWASAFSMAALPGAAIAAGVAFYLLENWICNSASNELACPQCESNDGFILNDHMLICGHCGFSVEVKDIND